jgi:predicted TIM-barrel fold metal-dependent hydrolase
VVSDTLILPWLERVRQELPELSLFDAHTHIGHNDPDGYSCTRRDLVEALERADARAVVFPMHEPDGYPPANDMVIAEAASSEGRLVPFCRLDPRADPVQEAERSLRAGARGLKLHPRAERFTLEEPGVDHVFALADERDFCVLVHAGRGIPALGRDALALCERHPRARLILAHAGICDLAWIWRAAPDHPNLFFDTSWWSPSDMLALFSLVPPGQILFGSDAPYGTPALGANQTLRYALQAGLSPEAVRSVAGGQLGRLIDGEEPLDLGAPPGPEASRPDPLLERVYAFLLSSLGQMFQGLEPTETLALAALACEVGDDAPQAEVCRSVLGLLEAREQSKSDTDPGRPSRLTAGIHLVVAAALAARTPDVPLPPEPVPVDVGERTP